MKDNEKVINKIIGQTALYVHKPGELFRAISDETALVWDMFWFFGTYFSTGMKILPSRVAKNLNHKVIISRQKEE